MTIPFRGCLETAALVAFALVVGAFATSAFLRHADRDDPAPADTLATPAPLPSEERARIRVEVRNGSGIEGAAGRMTEHLRDEGFDVVDYGNADRFDHARTVVLDRSGTRRAAREVAAALQGVPIRTAIDSTLFLDVTVVVGRDMPAILDAARRPSVGERLEGARRWIDRIPRPWD